MAARSRPYAIALGIVFGLVQFMALPASGDLLKRPPVTAEVSSLDELKRALKKATPRSVIRLAAGVYQIYADDPYFLVKGVQGLPDQPIVIQGAPAREDGRRPTIIDGGRSLDPMLELQEHYRRPGSRPIELQDLLIEKQFRTERAINCFVFENVAYLVIENLTVHNCLPIAFVFYANSQYVTIRSTALVGATFPVWAGRYSDHLLVEDNVWTQDPSGYTEDQSGYSGRVDLTPRPGRMWDTIPWGVVHHGSRAYLNGGLVGGFRTAGNIIIRHNIIRNTYNGIRIRANRCPRRETCNVNVEIYDNDFQFTRDNPLEPEDRAVNWWIFHNRIYNGHGWFSLDGVGGGPIYIFGNVGWFDDKPSRRCLQRDWAADQTIHAGKRYEPTPEGECSRSRTGKVFKFGTEPVELNAPIYIFNNSSYVRAPLIAGGRSKLRAWNNATEFCDPKTLPPGMCIADFEREPECVQSPAGAADPFANRFPVELDQVPFFDCSAASPGDESGHGISNHPDFPDKLATAGFPFAGWHGDPGFINPHAGDFRLRPDSLARGKACVVTRGGDGSLTCGQADQAADPDIGAFQGNTLTAGPDYLNEGDEQPRLVRASWLTGDDGIRLEVAFSTECVSTVSASLLNSEITARNSEEKKQLSCRKAKFSAANAGFLAVFLCEITAGSASLLPAVGREQLVEAGAQRQEVAPGFALALGRAQQKGRMKHRQCRNRLVEAGDREVEPPAAQSGDALALRQQRAGGGAAGEDEHLGPHQRNESEHERQARGDFHGCRRAVAGRAPIDDVGDQDTAAVEADRRQHAVEQLPRAADKGPADPVLVRAGGLADDHDGRRRVAIDEDRVRRRALQRATVKPGNQRRQRRHAFGTGGEPSCRLGGLAQRFGQRGGRGGRNGAG
jgi:hypothetical protein